jgi:hypothetical protein
VCAKHHTGTGSLPFSASLTESTGETETLFFFFFLPEAQHRTNSFYGLAVSLQQIFCRVCFFFSFFLMAILCLLFRRFLVFYNRLPQGASAQSVDNSQQQPTNQPTNNNQQPTTTNSYQQQPTTVNNQQPPPTTNN